MKTENTAPVLRDLHRRHAPQWSPVMKTENTAPVLRDLHRRHAPQWSPVMKTGNTRQAPRMCVATVACLNGARS